MLEIRNFLNLDVVLEAKEDNEITRMYAGKPVKEFFLQESGFSVYDDFEDLNDELIEAGFKSVGDVIVGHVVEDWVSRELYSCKELEQAEEFVSVLVERYPEEEQEGAREDLYIYAVTALGEKVAPEW